MTQPRGNPTIGSEPGSEAGCEDRFSIVAGGPFHRLLRRLGLTGPDQLPTRSAAFILALLAWSAPAVLAIAQSLADDGYSASGYFADSTVYTRFLIAIWIMVLTERYADGRLLLLARQFAEGHLLRPDRLPALRAALATADRRSSSALAEALIAVAAVVWSGMTARYAVEIAGASWEGQMVGGEVVLSWAGQAARFVSNPVFIFLVLRWMWWFVVWTALLLSISRLPLQLTPLHPDRVAVVQLLVAAGTPLVAVVVAQIGWFELVQWIVSTIL